MSNIKEKAKNYWEENKVKIIAVGGAAVVTLGAGFIAYKSYKDGFIDGGIIGGYVMIDWLDKTFPEESKARELVDRYIKEHPEKIVRRKGLGKWS